MTMSSAERAAYGGMFTAAALIFSYVETLIPLYFIPIPGLKLGLANICVMLCFYYIGALDAALVSLVRIILSALLFGTPISFLYSLSGGVLAFAFLPFAKYILKDKVSFIGVSVACAALHNVGQTVTASLVFKETSILLFLEWLLPISVLTGALTGCLALFFAKIMKKHPIRVGKHSK